MANFNDADAPGPDEWDEYVKQEIMDYIRLELERYAKLDNTELGEMSIALIGLYDKSHGLSEKAEIVIEEEMRQTLAAYLRTTRIVTRTHAYTYEEIEYDWEWEEE